MVKDICLLSANIRIISLNERFGVAQVLLISEFFFVQPELQSLGVALNCHIILQLKALRSSSSSKTRADRGDGVG